MKVNGLPTRTLRPLPDRDGVEIIDQTRLPFRYETRVLASLEDAAEAIRSMRVRGAPLIGATAAYGLALATRVDASVPTLEKAAETLRATRPTAVNLAWALARMRARLLPLAQAERHDAAWDEAARICDEDVRLNESIGRHGLAVIRDLAAQRSEPINVLTHCNAGWLATVDWGTALAPIYAAFDAGVRMHVWVDETRPRNQGASLTAWELGEHGVPHTLIADNAGGHLMRRGQVDMCLVGTDRTAANGDVANKIGTYLKALAAADNGVPFYVALPGPSIDWQLNSGDDIPIEERDATEVTHIQGLDASGDVARLRLAPLHSAAANPAFDVTPARLVTGLITERGVCAASREGLLGLYPERRG
jgi:methylthioribose-1-phosphate isomerase